MRTVRALPATLGASGSLVAAGVGLLLTLSAAIGLRGWPEDPVSTGARPLAVPAAGRGHASTAGNDTAAETGAIVIGTPAARNARPAARRARPHGADHAAPSSPSPPADTVAGAGDPAAPSGASSPQSGAATPQTGATAPSAPPTPAVPPPSRVTAAVGDTVARTGAAVGDTVSGATAGTALAPTGQAVGDTVTTVTKELGGTIGGLLSADPPR